MSQMLRLESCERVGRVVFIIVRSIAKQSKKEEKKIE